MSETLGRGDYTYRVEPGWGTLPPGWSYSNIAGIGNDRHDRVYVFSRGEHPVTVFGRDGTFLTSWGERIFTRPHAVHMGPDDTIYLTDNGRHTVRKFTLEGECLLEIGIPDRPSGAFSGQPFNQCTHTALSPEGDIYVSDGYYNARVHKYSPEGRLITSFGGSGTAPGEFSCPHNIGCDADGWVYVADRENHRIQVLDGNGRFEMEWTDVFLPNGLWLTPGSEPVCYIAEAGPQGMFRDAPNLGPRVSIFDHRGRLLSRVAEVPNDGLEPGQFVAPHCISVDSRGDIYVGELAAGAWPSRYPGQPLPEPLRCLQKFIRVTSPSED